jgi:hypothetical protein
MWNLKKERSTLHIRHRQSRYCAKKVANEAANAVDSAAVSFPANDAASDGDVAFDAVVVVVCDVRGVSVSLPLLVGGDVLTGDEDLERAGLSVNAKLRWELVSVGG